MPGYINEIEKQYLYENCKIFAYPSLYEGFGLPILEAMNNGALVLTSNNSSMPEVGGDAAIYIDNPENYMEIANKIKDILKLSDEERNNYIEKAYKKVREFDWNKCAEETLKVLIED